jgi:hypothetical protein
MDKIFGSSWRTSLMGYLTAIGVVIVPMIQQDGFDIKKQWPTLLSAAAIAIWGRIQKDSNGITTKEGQAIAQAVSGGTIPPPDKKD